MKTFKKDHLPEEVSHNGETYRCDNAITIDYRANKTNGRDLKKRFKKQGIKAVIVSVLSRKLVGKQDLHGKPYKPSIWIFTTA